MSEKSDFSKRLDDIREMPPGQSLWALLELLMQNGAKVEIKLVEDKAPNTQQVDL